MAQVIVVGGGLAGLSAAHTVLEHGANVLVLDKNSFLGGNSTKATSGINGALTKTQRQLGIPDSVESFYDDTARSARDLLRPGLVKVLTGNSASAVEWLQEKFGLDLSLVSRLGGHSHPRTHRGKEKFPGMTITYALMEKLEDLVKSDPERVKVLKHARVVQLLKDGTGKVIGVEYEKDGKLFQEKGPVVLATGGYAADFGENGLIKQYRPDIFHLPTTNGDYSTGDGIKMVRAIGGSTIDLEKVQVHPTGLVDPNEPDAKVKFLAAEALRGVGGLLLDRDGKRFCDELGHRDYVTGEMWKNNKAPYRLVLNSAAGKEIEWHCKHYMGRGLMKHFKNGKDLAKEMGISPQVLEETFETYNAIANNKNDPFGKKYFQNLPFTSNDEFYVAIITPVVHYCMGGLEINPEGEVQSNKQSISGLFAAGEVAGGVHGANRLGGSSLLGCVVYGRVSGGSAARYLLKNLTSGQITSGSATKRVTALSQQLQPPQVEVTDNSDLKFGFNITQPGVQTRVELEPNSRKLAVEISWDQNQPTSEPVVSSSTTPQISSSAPSAGGKTPAPASPAQAKEAAVDRNKEWTPEEVAKHNTEQDCWVIVNGQVLDVTSFLKDHPGGKKAILLYAGKDATSEFNMLHKADVVDKYAPNTVIGRIKGGAASGEGSHGSASKGAQKTQPSNVESLNSGGTADVLPQERKKATFDVEKLTNLLDGGPEQTKRRRFILSPNQGVDLSDKNNWDSREQLKQHVKHFMKVHESFWDTFNPTREEVVWMTENAMFSGSLMNHYGLFLPTLETHCSDQQRQWWSPRARRMQIVGCYAQTELGHGSNVRGLQTIATYNKETQEFILNTPTLKSMKWWPGTLGKVATHALVYAQLIIDGKEYGLHSFMLQIRDENHKPLPGIELGDLGPKLGDHANDTGYMRLDNVRVPREFMLAKYQHVTPEGVYKKSEVKEKNSKLHYTTMIFTRGAMLKSAGGYLARAATIAVRYSCVRKQGFVEHKKSISYTAPERAIIDYQVQRYRVLRQLANAYAIKFTGAYILKRFQVLDGSKYQLANVEELPEIAALSGGLKGLCTFLAWQGIEDLRKCCGGNGYLMSSGLAPLAANYVWQTTAEGDWTLLMLSSAQFVLKSLRNAMEGKPLSETVSYLAPLQNGTFDASNPSLPTANVPEDYLNIDFLLELFKYAALLNVSTAGNEFQTKLSEHQGKFDEAFNQVALLLVNAVRSHSFTYILTNFIRVVKECQDPSLKKVLDQLCALFALSNILDDPQWNGLVAIPQMQMVKQIVPQLMDRIRPNVVALVDAFEFSDNTLGSTIGKFDGNVYEALYEVALKAPLNQQDPFDGYKEYLQPHLDLEFLKKGNIVPKDSKL